MGVHTGDSVTVAPQMTLSDEAYQELRDAAAAVDPRGRRRDRRLEHPVRARPRDRRDARDRDEPARLALVRARVEGDRLPDRQGRGEARRRLHARRDPERPDRTTPASFEPTLDYVVVKFPRFAFEKFPGADQTLGTQMKSVGETMGIGRTFAEAFLKAMRSRELDAGAGRRGRRSPTCPRTSTRGSRTRSSDLRETLSLGATTLRAEARRLVGRRPGRGGPCRRPASSASGPSTAASTRAPARSTPTRTTSTRPGARRTRRRPSRAARVVILGSGPNRIGQGIEFDYCCVHAAQSFRALGYEAVMVNCNPETVSTDYDTSDRLYFEPLDVEEVLAVCEREQPDGVVIQFGGQTPLKLARAIEDAGLPILGTPFEAIDLAEDRERFGALARRARHPLPGVGDRRDGGRGGRRSPSGSATRCSCGPRTCSAAARCASATGRGGASTRSQRRCTAACSSTASSRARSRSTSTRSATATETYVGAVMQHVEEAGVHSGDSSCVLPAPSLDARQRTPRSSASSAGSAPALGVVGLLNVQLAVADGEVYVLEVNPRASRTVPFASKATGVNLVEAACRLAAGARSPSSACPPERAAGAGQRQGGGAAVRALPRLRPGARPGDALDRRGDGDAPTTCRPRSRRPSAPPAGRCRRAAPRSSRCATPTSRPSCRSRPRSPASASSSSRPAARRRRSRAAGLEVERGRARSRRGDGADGRRPDPARALRPRRQHAAGRRAPRADGYLIREAALVARVPVHHDDPGRRGGRARDRERARRDRASRSRSGSMPRARSA